MIGSFVEESDTAETGHLAGSKDPKKAVRHSVLLDTMSLVPVPCLILTLVGSPAATHP
jgi:hypothetical protein